VKSSLPFIQQAQGKDKTNEANEKLKKEIAKSPATNEKLRQESTQLTRSL
jgi:hypothetical protein